MISTLWASKSSTMWWAWSWKREGHGDGNDQAFSKYSKYQVCNVFTISLKRSYEWSSQFLIKLLIFDDSSQTCPKYQKRKFDKFYQYIKRKYCNCFCVLLWCGTFRYFTGFQPCLLLHFFGWLWSKMGVVF